MLAIILLPWVKYARAHEPHFVCQSILYLVSVYILLGIHTYVTLTCETDPFVVCDFLTVENSNKSGIKLKREF